MAESRGTQLREIMRPKLTRFIVGLSVAAGLYQFACDQFHWPTIPALFGMTSFPWWAWLFVAQLGLLYGLFEYVRRNASPTSDAPSRDKEQHSELNTRLGRVEADVASYRETHKAVINDYQRMSGLEARFSDMLDKLKGEIHRRDDTIAANHAALQDRVVAAEGDIAKLRQEHLAHLSLSADNVGKRFNSIYLAIAAIWHRERLNFLAHHIDVGAAELAAPTQAEARYDQEGWEAWEAKERAWQMTVTTWCDLAECYVPGIRDKVLTASDGHYKLKGVATVDQFPDAEAFFGYKTFCAIWKNWCNWREEAERAVHQVAFNGGGRSVFPGAGDMEELGAREDQ